MDARPHLIAIILVFFALFALPSCQRQSVSPGSLPPAPIGGGGSLPTSTPIPPPPASVAPSATFVAQPSATPVSVAAAPAPAPAAQPVGPPSGQGGGASVVQTVIVTATSLPPCLKAGMSCAPPVNDLVCNQRGSHVVAAGENLYRIALRYRMSIEGIARLNNIWDPNYLRPGQRLHTRTCYAIRSQGWWAWERGGVNEPIPNAPVAGNTNDSVYTVQQGDNLFRISVKFNTTVRDLMTANGLTNDNVATGQRLFVP